MKNGKEQGGGKGKRGEKRQRGEGPSGTNRIKKKAPAPGIMGEKEGGDTR
jgi:hypothetical protein